MCMNQQITRSQSSRTDVICELKDFCSNSFDDIRDCGWRDVQFSQFSIEEHCSAIVPLLNSFFFHKLVKISFHLYFWHPASILSLNCCQWIKLLATVPPDVSTFLRCFCVLLLSKLNLLFFFCNCLKFYIYSIYIIIIIILPFYVFPL